MALLEQSILLWKHLTKFSSWGNSASSVSQPKVLGAYNNFSSDFNKQDWLVSKWSTSIKDRNRLKIILVIIHWKINMHCECIIHKFVNKDKKQFINVLDFKKDICLAYLKPSSERPSGVRKDGTPKPSAFQDDIRIDMGRHSNGKKNDVALPCEATLRKTTNPWSSLFLFTKNTCWESPERPCEDAQMQCIHKMTLIFAQWSIHKLAYVCRRCFPSVWFIGQSVFSFLMLIKDVLVLHFDFQVL